ncbi:MAG: ribosome small subunit-dependent GTPase A [Clostridia bacterium]|nr:ribosome small subunit-dependent GTPase A [Clostridia bacterium]
MQKGIITCIHSNQYDIKVNQETYTCVARGKWKKEQITPVVGDNVAITITNEVKKEGVMEQIEPRSNFLKRPKIANLTQMIFVVSMNMPKPDLLLLDKQLAFAMFNQIEPIICINKVDLATSEEVLKIETIYQKAGYLVICTNAKQGESIQALKEVLQGNVTAFAGNSGVGKSTLINCIFENTITEEGNISKKNQKGKNTTTAITLYEIAPNSYIADTPGFSTFSIEEIESSELANYFQEFKPWTCNCEFVGCSHQKEEHCGIKEAVEKGKISQERYANYCKIYQELKEREEHRW